MIPTKGYAAKQAKGALEPFSFERKAPGPKEVLIEIAYCGVCHSDLHKVNNDWGGSAYPLVPGHEIVGIVNKVGKDVKRFKPGDNAGVGCFIDSCRNCEACKDHEEQYCASATWTYGAKLADGLRTYGGYSERIVVNEDFVLTIAKDANLASTAPLLCAGITTYSPLKHWNVGKGQNVGIVGLGGLGHMGLKLAKSFGAKVVAFTHSPKKKEDALRLGADEVIVTSDVASMEKHKGSFDFILDTVSAPHDLNQMLGMLRRNGHYVIVGVPSDPHAVHAFSLIEGRHSLSGSLIGGIKQTQEMLDYCAKKGIVSDVEVIPMQDINKAYERMLKGDVRYRFVIDMKSLK
ncbi:MAG: NAD(P)-dependent alcohol dehydrogenase [Nanoarchaeota archaeon]|nr:NAD(P)-dependent alcohol dehydrogenase [Nanoarchaeota archaeon]